MATDPHENDPQENPLDHLGEEIPDPWDDASQGDWTDRTVTIDPKVEEAR